MRSIRSVANAPGSNSGRRTAAIALGLAVSLAASSDPTTLTPSNASVTVGTTATTLNSPVTRTGDILYDAYLNYRTVDGTAVAGIDYTAASGAILIPAGAASANVPVNISAASGSGGADKTFQLLTDSATGVGPSPSYAGQQSFAVGSSPSAIAKADLNGDGLLDLVIANTGSDNVSVLLNTTVLGAATLSFGPQQTFPTGSQPRGVIAADFNGDGRPDLAVANFNSNTISVLLNTTAAGAATASFAAAQTFATNANPGALAATDVNGDGLLDLVSANVDATVSVLLNTTVPGATTLNFASQSSFVIAGASSSIVAVDMNGDGLADLIVDNASASGVSVLLNATAPGASTASYLSQQSFPGGGATDSAIATDINGDGKPDVILTHAASSTVTVLRNTIAPGATTVSFAADQTFTTGNNPVWVSAADLNGDGKPELFTANSTAGTVSVLVNTAEAGALTSSFAARQSFAAENGTGAVLAGDFNGDGMPELVATNKGNASVSVLLNTTPLGGAVPDLDAAQSVNTGTAPMAVAAADLNGDGRPDLITANSTDSTVSVLLNTTTPGAAAPAYATQQVFTTDTSPASDAIADINGDGRLDVITANKGASDVSVLVNTTAPGATTPSFAAKQDFILGGNPSSVVTADLNGDGKPDLIVADSVVGVSVRLNTTVAGSATAAFSAAPLAFATGITPISVTAADVDLDGRPDLIVANAGSNNVAVLLNTTAPGAILPSFAVPQNFVTGIDPRAVVAADLNGDGRPDLIVANFGSNNLSVLLNTTAPGATTPNFATVQTAVTGIGPAAVAATTTDSEGRLYVLVANQTSNNLTVLLNTSGPGSGTVTFFAPQATFATGTALTSVAVADVNLDGKPDAVITNAGSNTVSVLLNTQYRVVLGAAAVTGTLSFLDLLPDAFSFTPATGVDPSTVQTSDTITIVGIDTGVPISIANGRYSLNGAAFTTAAGTANAGDSLSVQAVASNNFAATITATLTVGGVQAGYSVTTRNANTTPTPFSFMSANGVDPGSVQTSSSILVLGIEAPVTISITGGSYSINGAAFVTAAGTVSNANSVAVRQIASSSFATTTTTVLTIGGVSGSYAVTTEAAPPPPPPPQPSPSPAPAPSPAASSGGGAINPLWLLPLLWLRRRWRLKTR